jgi:uncharacterized protein YjbJ (UPF0337 family)
VNEPTRSPRGLLDRVQGKVKEVAGTLTGNRALRHEGELHQEKADALDEATQRDVEAERAAAEAEVVAREQELAVEARELAAEEAAEAREQRLEREHAEEQLKIDADTAARKQAVERAATDKEQAVARSEAAARHARTQELDDAAALETEAQRARETAEALARAANDDSKGTP